MENDEKNMLSQDEIDALLSVTEDEEEMDDDQTEESSSAEVSDYLSSIEADAIGEIGNISIGSSATTLSTLLNQKVSITTPTVSIIKKPELYESFSYEHVNVQVNYVEGFVGQNIFVVQTEDAAIIADIMLGGDGTNPDEELTDIHLSAVQEVMNQMMGSAATSMSTIFNKKVNISPPTIEIQKADHDERIAEDIDEKVFVKVSFQLKIGDLIDSSIMQLIPFPFAYDLVEELLESSESNSKQEVPSEIEEDIEEVEKEPSPQEKEPSMEAQSEMSIDPPNREQEAQTVGHPTGSQEASVQKASFANFESVELDQKEQRNLDILLDVPLQITVELGRTKRPIKDILDLAAGSIIELDKLAGEPVDILVNQKLIAQGEVVVIDENFGVRVTEIISQSERIMSLQ